MNKYLILLIIFASSCVNNLKEPQEEHLYSWPLLPDSMNLAILIVDYQTYEFEGGNLSYYPLCANCDSDSLPFSITFISPGDFGEITFSYTETNDTLFRASIVWMGLGEILYPDEFVPADSFQTVQESIEKPELSEYFDYWLGLDESTFYAKTDLAWASISSIHITNDFATELFRVGFYLYTPSVGVFDPDPAKWIIFLYRGNY